MGYGGVAGNGEHVGYAIKVHEDMSARHTVGKAQYLRDPFNRHRQTFERQLAKDVRAFIRRASQ
jgi:hypothetical protein